MDRRYQDPQENTSKLNARNLMACLNIQAMIYFHNLNRLQVGAERLIQI